MLRVHDSSVELFTERCRPLARCCSLSCSFVPLRRCAFLFQDIFCVKPCLLARTIAMYTAVFSQIASGVHMYDVAPKKTLFARKEWMCECILTMSSLMSQMEYDLIRYCKQTSDDGEKKAKYYCACMQWKILGTDKSPTMKCDTVLTTGTQKGTACSLLMLARLIISDLNKLLV